MTVNQNTGLEQWALIGRGQMIFTGNCYKNLVYLLQRENWFMYINQYMFMYWFIYMNKSNLSQIYNWFCIIFPTDIPFTTSFAFFLFDWDSFEREYENVFLFIYCYWGVYKHLSMYINQYMFMYWFIYMNIQHYFYFFTFMKQSSITKSWSVKK